MTPLSARSLPGRRLLYGSLVTALLPFLTGCAIRSTQGANGEIIYSPQMHFWETAHIAVKILLTVVSAALLVWVIGGMLLGYLIFAATSNSLTAVRWGYFIGGLFWLLFVMAFLWLVLLVKPLFLLGVLVGGLLLGALLLFVVFKPSTA
ncbi:MAG TPA: hypothetical protein VKU00_05085 [Chthonomonadaceae bacterium]|nr:hypothetical protein [Chthonomonadaceae bacterium]